MSVEAADVLRIAVAAVCGAAVGVERQWSGHATGPRAGIGGIRTFTLFGALAGIAGWMWTLGLTALAAVLLAGGVALIVSAFLAISHREVQGTTEVAALVTMAAGVLAGLGYLALASAIIALTSLLLVEKSRLHAAVERFDDEGLRAGVRFAVMAVVILPLLPEGPYGPLGGIRPRLLWVLVLFFSGMSFVGYIARRTIGAKHGYALAGLLGGLVSSTNVTFTFSRESAHRPEVSRPLAFGILAACTVMFVRVLVATAVLNADLMVALLPYLIAPFLVGATITLVRWRRLRRAGKESREPTNPLALRSALQMAAIFQVVLFLVHGAKERWGNSGLVVSGAILGLTDMDALTISMARSASDPAALRAASQAIAIGILSNTIFKAGIAAIAGRSAVRLIVPVGLAAMAAVLSASIYFLR